MAIRPIIEVPNPRLKLISAPVTQVDDTIRALVADMLETMYAAPGIGLAAIQIDVPLRVLVMDLEDGPVGADGKPGRHPRIFINPELYAPSAELHVYQEGCLSVPDQFADVERPAVIHARWLDEQGKAHDERLDGLTATCLQHEMDHLDGILFIDHLSRLKRELLLKKLEKARTGRRRAA